jgi:hypothetical protein
MSTSLSYAAPAWRPVGSAPVVSVQSAGGAALGGSSVPLAERLRKGASTTPGRMRVLSLVTVAGFALAAIVGVAAVDHRRSGVRTVATQSAPLIVDAQAIDTLLSQADAAAANAFLSGGLESAAQRSVYQGSLQSATNLLTDATGRSANRPEARLPLQTLTEQIPVYAGLVETARANNRQLFPVGAAYLRQASRLMAGTILPAAQRLYAVDSDRLRSGDNQARSPRDTAALAVMVVVLIAALAGVQIWLRRRTNRLFNLPLVVASVVSVLVLLFALFSVRAEADQMSKAVTGGYARVNALAQARIGAFTAKGDESLTLIGRGNGGAFETDFKAQMTKVQSFLAQADGLAVLAADRTTADNTTAALAAYLRVHAAIRTADDGGQFDKAVALAVDPSSSVTSANGAFAALDRQLTDGLDASQQEFSRQTSVANNDLTGMTAIVVLVLLGAAILALYGLQQRINEYR